MATSVFGHVTSVVPVKVKRHSVELETDVLRVVAFRPVCACGWKGKSYGKRRDAAIGGLEHGDDEEAKSSCQ